MVATLSPALIGERVREGQNPSATIPYMIEGAPERQIAIQVLVAGTEDSFALSNGNRLPRTGYELTYLGDGKWRATVDYQKGSGPDDERDQTFQIDFDISGGTQKITHSIATVASYAPSGQTAPNHNRAIGVTKDSIEGCEIVVPTFAWTERHRLRASQVTGTYIAGLRNLVGRTNEAEFRGIPAGEVLAMGVVGARDGEETWDVQFKFAAQGSIVNASLGDITGINKTGWEYLWVYSEEEEDDDSNLVKIPRAVYIEQVYYAGDFSDFGIPTGAA